MPAEALYIDLIIVRGGIAGLIARNTDELTRGLVGFGVDVFTAISVASALITFGVVAPVSYAIDFRVGVVIEVLAATLVTVLAGANADIRSDTMTPLEFKPASSEEVLLCG